MANVQNLVPATKATARARGSKGGYACAEAKRKRKSMREQMEMLMALPLQNPELKEHIAQMDIPPESIDNQLAILVGLSRRALSGDVAATREVRAILGEDAFLRLAEQRVVAEEQAAAQQISRSEAWPGLPALVMGKAFVDVYRDARNRKHSRYDFKGGRGSLKSSFCALLMVDELERNPAFCGIAIRQVKDTLKDSVYAQLCWAIDVLGLAARYKCTRNPMAIRRISTGQLIFFRGADDPTKIKSIRPPRGMHIGVVWFEEADQLHGDAAFRSILQSTLRGGEGAIVLRSYNTPISAQHFLNRDALKEDEKRLIHHSHYHEAPPEWLGKEFFDAAEELRATNERAFRHEYGGEAVGTGGSVFENVEASAITDEEIERFDRIYMGIDWGWYPDPFHWAKMHYDAARRTLYLFDEYRANKEPNRVTGEALRDKKGVTPQDLITADSADPKSIADYKEFGFRCRGAEKGPGSVDYGMKWLQSLAAIVIDPARCPHTVREFGEYEYERDKDGEIISGYPDAANHAIDAVRYAMETVWRKRGQ